MYRYGIFAKRLRNLYALVLVFVISGVVFPQHEGHVMSKPVAKPNPKAAPRRSRARASTRRATTTRKPKAAAPRTTPVTQQPATRPSPSPGPSPVDHSIHQAPAAQTPSQTPSPQPVPEIQRPRRQVIPIGPVMTLEELEALAVQQNPTLAQAEAAVRSAEGRRRQAGMFPNPVAGYFLEEFVFRSPGETAEQGIFVEQTIPLGGKLSKAQRVFGFERDQAAILSEAQSVRVTNSIRLLYHETLGAQRLVELRDDLSQLAREAVEITKELYNVGQADRPDQLEIEIEAERAEIDFLRAKNEWQLAWRSLAAMVGNPNMAAFRLAGEPDASSTPINEAQLMESLMSQSPDIRVAQTAISRAEAVLERARAERVPDLFLRGGLGYNYERLEPMAPAMLGRRKGAEGRLEVGVNVPIFNRNQGGIEAAKAELAIAELDLRRLRLSLQSRFASRLREYRNAEQMVERYRTQVVPRARQAYEMYLANVRQMAAAYPQVLIAQRTLFQVEVEYARALVELRQTAIGLRGFLLEGGLESIERSRGGTEGFRLRAPSEATGDSDNR